MGGGLPDPGLLGALVCGLPGGTGFRSSTVIKIVLCGFKKVGIVGAGSGSRTGSTTPSSTSPSASSSLWVPLIGLVLPVSLLSPELHGDDRQAPVEVVLLVFSMLFTAVLLLCL